MEGYVGFEYLDAKLLKSIQNVKVLPDFLIY